MAETNGKKISGALLIGRRGDAFVEGCLDKTARHGINCRLCRDIYAALGKLITKSDSSETLIIGRVGELCGRNGRFLEKVSSHSVICCCLAERPLQAAELRVMMSCDSRVFVISDVEEVDEVILKASAPDKGAAAGNKTKATLTQQEMDALLGG